MRNSRLISDWLIPWAFPDGARFGNLTRAIVPISRYWCPTCWLYSSPIFCYHSLLIAIYLQKRYLLVTLLPRTPELISLEGSIGKHQTDLLPNFRSAESMVMKFQGNVRGKVRVNFLALFASKPHIFMRGALTLSGIVRANVRLNIAIPMLFWSLPNLP